MTDLTEKWKKGELTSGWYWVEGSRAEGIYAYTAEYLNNMYRPRNSERIIEKVPSYEEWKALIDLYKEADVIIKKSDKENIKIKTDCRTLAQKLLQVKPELREWLEVNYGEYL